APTRHPRAARASHSQAKSRPPFDDSRPDTFSSAITGGARPSLSNGGRDFAWLCEALAARGWRVGALILDAADFTPQSRPRLFIVAYRGAPPAFLASESPGYGHTRGLIDAVGALDEATRSAWVWWRLAPPPVRNASLEDLTERIGAHLGWRSQEALDKLLSQMTPAHRARVEAARAEGVYRVGAVYRRIRDGVQRAEVRYDGLAGCVRTLKGGSSRQLLLVSAAGELRLRAMTAVESARLMGLPADYKLPPRATAAFNLTGDGVCAPVVRWLGLKLLAPLAEAAQGARDGRNRRPLERSVTG
ncbi:MAG: DNA cytosine methyltransferase, partial [Pseudomonadota bacterium]